MIDFPNPDAVEAELSATGLLPVLFSHSCAPEAHALHEQLATHFASAKLKLLLDPFNVGDDVQLAMRRLEIHGLVFHCTNKSVLSEPVKIELDTAEMLNAPILCLRDSAPIPSQFLNRIFQSINAQDTAAPKWAPALADAMRSRSRVHWVLCWLRDPGRSVWEREGGINWLLEQPAQILAEFKDSLISLHRGTEEDATISSRLAAVLARTGLRRECHGDLRRWWIDVKHILSRDVIEEILKTWGFSVPCAEEEKPSLKQQAVSINKGSVRSAFLQLLLLAALIAGADFTHVNFDHEAPEGRTHIEVGLGGLLQKTVEKKPNALGPWRNDPNDL